MTRTYEQTDNITGPLVTQEVSRSFWSFSYWNISIVILSVIPSIFNMFRRLDSGDYERYYNSFLNIDYLIKPIKFDRLFYVFLYVANKTLGGSWEAFAFITTFMMYFFTLQAIRIYGEDNKYNKTTIIFGISLILFNPQFFLFSGHLVKMWLAYSFCLYGIVYYFANKKTNLYCIFAALLYHSGSIFILFIHVLYELFSKASNIKLIGFTVAVLFFLLSRTISFDFFYSEGLSSRVDSMYHNEYNDYYQAISPFFIVLMGTSLLCSIYLLFQRQQKDKTLSYTMFYVCICVFFLRNNYLIAYRILDFLFFIMPLLAMTVLKNEFVSIKILCSSSLLCYFILKVSSYSFFW